MIPKDVYTNTNLMSNEFALPCIIFLEKYKSKSNTVYTTLGCILDKFNISSISKNTTRIKSLLTELINLGYISLEAEIVNLNTPLEINVRQYEQGDFFTTIQDFELDAIINIVAQNNVSYMIMNMFVAIKRRAGFINILNNQYDASVIGYRKLMDEIGIKSFNTMSKYVGLLESEGILSVDRTKNNTEDGIKTINTYSFKNITK